MDGTSEPSLQTFHVEIRPGTLVRITPPGCRTIEIYPGKWRQKLQFSLPAGTRIENKRLTPDSLKA